MKNNEEVESECTAKQMNSAENVFVVIAIT